MLDDAQNGVSFAASLVQEDDQQYTLVDAQGKWLVDVDDVVRIEDIPRGDIPQGLARLKGRPIVLQVRDGAQITEIRRWTISNGGLGPEIRDPLSEIFALGARPGPVAVEQLLGEDRLAELERLFSRRLGWAPPNEAASRQLSRDPRTAASKTIVVNNGSCDVDEPF